MEKLKKLLWAKKLNKLKRDIEKEGDSLAKIYKMVSFRIINGSLSEFQSNTSNSAYDSSSERFYVSKIPPITIEALIKELKRISHNTIAIQLEFDEYNGGKNVEIEFYDLKSKKDIHHLFEIVKPPCSVALSERFYYEFIDKLREGAYPTESK
ncbi:hypothetical protein [Bacillus sp. AFS040349]|uniref:hypothetical protein n=1 Tax=Bacillus sp. AFS040349 TaxID=2033502 RepID=UPI000BFBEFBC|nr:hypothetical protein [Bacillus sp. AFS040349]PGT83283.1 hypothetical protein COD11_13185 [Bacillus sp. AFS040349]